MLRVPGLTDAGSESWKLRLEFDSCVRRIAAPSRRVDAPRAVFDDLPAEAREYFVVAADGSLISDALSIELWKRG